MGQDAWQTGCNSAIFEKLASTQPLKVALISRNCIITYAALNERASQLARLLLLCGIGPESVVGVRFARGIEYIVSMLAIWKAGGAYLPLDVSLPLERVKFIVHDAKATLIISKSNLVETGAFVPDVDFLFLGDEDLQGTLDNLPHNNLPQVAGRDSLAYVLYTSGTSGKPKGVAITHGSIVNMADDTRQSREIGPFDTVLLFAPFCFDASIRDIHGALLTGATLYVPEEEEILPGNIIDTLREQRITYVVVTPSVLRACTVEELPLLRTIVVAGEAVSENVIRNWGPGRTLINAYGPTEATVCSTKRVYSSEQPFQSGLPVSIGTPILNTRIHILDDACRPVPPGSVGEICIHGPGVSRRGYLNLPELNARCFRDDLFPGHPGRTYRTGDRGRLLPSGEVEFLGRKDAKAQIKLHGQRIETEEIEAVLRTDPEVLDGVVILRGAEGSRSLVAYVVPAGGLVQCGTKRELTSRLERLLRSHLPSYSVPSAICVIDSFPTHTTGKLNADALPDPASERGFLFGDESADARRELSPHQRNVADVLLRALGQLPLTGDDTRITPDTTYGELGGTSLQASVVLQRINHAFGCRLLLGQMYRQNMTVERLAGLVSRDTEAAATDNRSSLVADLPARARLPSDIVPCRQMAPQEAQNYILLTGATGYLGAHALAEILKSSTDDPSYRVTCVVRAADARTAEARVHSALQSWGIWDDGFAGRFRGVAGDIARPFLGMDIRDYLRLAGEVGAVWHSAAAVSFIAPYEAVEGANVAGTVQVLRFAGAVRQKRLVYVSTLAVFFGATDDESNDATPAPETSVAHLGGGGGVIVTGYAQTKWVAEQLVLRYQQRGAAQVIICRPARLLGSLAAGRCPRDDMTVRLIASFIETGRAPDVDWLLDLTPVDACARTLVDLAAQGTAGIFHFINQRTITLRALVEHLNSFLSSSSSPGVHHHHDHHRQPIQLVPYPEWKATAVLASAALAPLATLFLEPVVKGRSAFEVLLELNRPFRTSAYSTDATAAALRDKTILPAGWCPDPRDLLMGYLTRSDDIVSLFEGRSLSLSPPSPPSRPLDNSRRKGTTTATTMRTLSSSTRQELSLPLATWGGRPLVGAVTGVEASSRLLAVLAKMKLTLRRARQGVKKTLSRHSGGGVLKRRGTGGSAVVEVVG